MTVLWFF